MNHRGNVPALTKDQAQWLRNLFIVRRRFTNKYLAKQLKVSVATVVKYGTGKRGK